MHSAALSLSSFGVRGGKRCNKGNYPSTFIWPVCHVLRSSLPPGCASDVLPGSTSLGSRMSHQALCRHISTLSAQALVSTEHSQIHKQPSLCDTTSSPQEQTTVCGFKVGHLKALQRLHTWQDCGVSFPGDIETCLDAFLWDLL